MGSAAAYAAIAVVAAAARRLSAHMGGVKRAQTWA